jgi:Flp pilus assembly protein TadG
MDENMNFIVAANCVRSTKNRCGKILVLLAISIPVWCGIAGLIIDGGVLMLEARHTQNVSDAAATAAATELRLGNPAGAAITAAQNEVTSSNAMTSATVAVQVPPTSGPYAGSPNYAEVRVEQSVNTHFIHVLTGRRTETVAARAVAGVESATAGAAIVVLDPNPAQFSVSPLPISVPLNLPSLVGGLEVLGAGRATVQGAVLVNNRWGGFDEHGQPVGDAPGPPYAVSCTPLASTTTLYCTDLRVAGGVDNPSNYQSLQSGQPNPLHANRLAVPDPLKDLPVPTTSADPANVKTTEFGGKTIGPLTLTPQTLNPGVYDYLEITTTLATVTLNPGVYVVRGQNPSTGQSLNLAGRVQANGVMFYVTNTASYSPGSGTPDINDGENAPPGPSSNTLTPSSVINLGVTGSSFSPLNSPGSPFHGMMLFQRRQDRRPVVFVQENLLNAGTLQGTVYAKWGHIILAGIGNYDARFVGGTMRLIALVDMSINPSNPFPPARDVFLVE